MTKLCPRGKAAAKRKFKVYPSAYANAYASKICAGKIKDPSGTKRKDWGPKKAALGLFAASKMGKDKLKKLAMKRASMATPNTYLATQYFNSGKEVKKPKNKNYDMTATELNALVKSVNDPNPKKKDRIYSSGNKMKIKRSKENINRFQCGGMARGMGAAIKGGKFEGVF